MKSKRNPNAIFIAIGLMINSAALLLSHFTKLPDFVLGSLMGIGIGVMLLAVIKQKSKATC